MATIQDRGSAGIADCLVRDGEDVHPTSCVHFVPPRKVHGRQVQQHTTAELQLVKDCEGYADVVVS